MARCLVLGANGFIGSYLVENLINDGHFVRCFDRYKSKDIMFDKKAKNVEIYRGDFLSRNSIDIALKDIDYVFHFISSTTPISSENDPIIDIETNIKMSVELFELCVKHRINKLIFSSTGGAIYGESNIDLVTENVYPRPVSPYAIGKLTIENYLRYFNKKYSLKHMTFRISNPYGPRQNTLSGQGVVSIFLEKCLNNKPLLVYGDGSMVRDYIYVEDVAQMIASSFQLDNNEDVYNLGSGTGHSVNNIIEVIQKVTSKDLQIKYLPKPETFVQKIILNSNCFAREFKVKPEISLEKGIYKTWQALNQPKN